MQHASGFLDLVNEAKKHIRECTVAEVRARQQAGGDFRLIDVRDDSEWQAGHIPGAIHLGKGVIERDIEGKFPGRDTPLVLYCGGGYRSALAAEAIQKMGYTDVLSMDGGMRGWREAGYPEEKP
jgi:rhodanese-related sulfurtransferase